jgi:A/G-specific adenine glycosylase
LLSWYDQSGRELPWRVRGGRADPYRVWLSEIMLQQTTVAAVAPYFARFLERWPDVAALAAAPRDEVLSAWAGLGYYSRARNLHAAAQKLAAEGFPETEEGWRKLPGVGAYTAAAIAAIAYQLPANVVDGNVERVMARLRAVETPLPDAKPELKALAGELVAADRPGDWAQAPRRQGRAASALRRSLPYRARRPVLAGATTR